MAKHRPRYRGKLGPAGRAGVCKPNAFPTVAGAHPHALASPLGLTTHTKEVVVGPSSPPVPGKLDEKIWRDEYINLSALLPHRLGAPETTPAKALQRRTREK